MQLKNQVSDLDHFLAGLSLAEVGVFPVRFICERCFEIKREVELMLAALEESEIRVLFAVSARSAHRFDQKTLDVLHHDYELVDVFSGDTVTLLVGCNPY